MKTEDRDHRDRLDSGLDTPRHVGRHHQTRCGWRPILGNHACPVCPPRCPDCGASDGTRPRGEQ